MAMGESHCLLLAREGARVVVTDINTEAGEATAQQIPDEGGEAVFIHHDVASEEQWQSVIDQGVAAYDKIDILINNAGIVISKPNETTTVEDWDLTMAVNSTSVFLGCKTVVPAMAKAGGGSIVNISSISGIAGMPTQAAYQAGKGAVRLLSKSIAVDTPNTISAATVLTPVPYALAVPVGSCKNPVLSTPCSPAPFLAESLNRSSYPTPCYSWPRMNRAMLMAPK
tara:strand:- start:1873 stop:2550 length:678 start_codon:yes stop_codon:yes gene_type:complete